MVWLHRIVAANKWRQLHIIQFTVFVKVNLLHETVAITWQYLLTFFSRHDQDN